MPVIVKNIGTMNPSSPSGHGNTKAMSAVGSDAGTVRAIYQGKEYVFGPNQAITFHDDGIANGVAAFNSNLTVFPADSWR